MIIKITQVELPPLGSDSNLGYAMCGSCGTVFSYDIGDEVNRGSIGMLTVLSVLI